LSQTKDFNELKCTFSHTLSLALTSQSIFKFILVFNKNNILCYNFLIR